MLVVLKDPDRINYAWTQDQGQDLRFYDELGALLPHEIEKWDEDGESIVWVRIPEVAAASTENYLWMLLRESGSGRRSTAERRLGQYLCGSLALEPGSVPGRG